MLRGKHSVIYVRDDRLIKRFKPELRYNFIKEAQILTSLQPFGFVPKIYSVNLRCLEIEMEFVRGEYIGDILPHDKEVVMDSLKICRKLDLMGIQKEEMRNPYKHIIKADRVVFIDFERSVIKDRPSNLTQFLNYLNSKLRIFSISELKDVSKRYKKDFSDDTFIEILNRVNEAL